MANNNLLQIISVLLFLLIPIPSEKFSVLNGLLFLFAFLDLFIHPHIVNMLGVLVFITAMICIVMKKKVFIALGYALSLIWLAPQLLGASALKSPLFLCLAAVYAALAVLVVILHFKKPALPLVQY